MRIDVGVCTFRRESVTMTLQSLADQVLPGAVRMRVIVADNDESPSIRDGIERFAAKTGMPVRYVHAPARNISIARNACLDASDAPFFAFVDDDEVARPDWLAQLLRTAERTGAGVVFGSAVAVYPPDAPPWMREVDAHSNFPARRKGILETGHSGNVLLDRRDPRLRDARFSTVFGRTGGEDTDYFLRLHRAGVQMESTPDAVVDEPVAPSRLSLGWLLRRFRMNGAVYGYSMLDAPQGSRPSRLGLLGRSMAKVIYCGARTIVAATDGVAARLWLLRGAFHAGVAAGCLRRPNRELYGR